MQNQTIHPKSISTNEINAESYLHLCAKGIQQEFIKISKSKHIRIYIRYILNTYEHACIVYDATTFCINGKKTIMYTWNEVRHLCHIKNVHSNENRTTRRYKIVYFNFCMRCGKTFYLCTGFHLDFSHFLWNHHYYYKKSAHTHTFIHFWFVFFTICCCFFLFVLP